MQFHYSARQLITRSDNWHHRFREAMGESLCYIGLGSLGVRLRLQVEFQHVVGELWRHVRDSAREQVPEAAAGERHHGGH